MWPNVWEEQQQFRFFYFRQIFHLLWRSDFLFQKNGKNSRKEKTNDEPAKESPNRVSKRLSLRLVQTGRVKRSGLAGLGIVRKMH